MLEYWFVGKFFFFCFFVSFFLFILSFFFVFQMPEFSKLLAYECGFDPFGDARNKFEVRFYLVGILFIVFDLELTFLFPWVITLSNIGFMGFGVMLFFLFILTVDSFMNELVVH